MISALLLLLASSAAPAEVAFEIRADTALRAAPNSLGVLDCDPPLLFVASDTGLFVFRQDGNSLALAAKRSAGEHIASLAVGELAPDAAYVVYAKRGAHGLSIVAADRRGELAQPHDVPLPATPRAIKIRPLGGNRGRAIFVAHRDGFTVITGDPNSGFGSAVIPGPRFPVDFDVADTSGDGHSDLVMVEQGIGQVALAESDGQGGFRPFRVIARVSGARRVLAADANGDGQPEIFVLGDKGLSLHWRDRSGSFSNSRELWRATHLRGLAAGDLTGDGHLDLVISDRSPGTITTLAGVGDGRFTAGDSYIVGDGPGAVVMADLSGDERLDVLVSNEIGNSVTWLRNTGGGVLDGSLGVLSELKDLGAITVADFDLDSHLDLAVTCKESGLLEVFLGDGEGRFAALPPTQVGRQPSDLVAGFFDGDEAPDLAVANFGSDEVAILIGDGRGGFASPALIPVGSGPSAIVTGSFGGPAERDLAVANRLSGSVTLLHSDGRGHFTVATSVRVRPRPSFLMVGDTDRDGYQDLLVGSDYGESVTILRGDGAGLQPPEDSALGEAAHPSLAEDLDGDGNVDLVVLNKYTGTLNILPGTGPGRFGEPRNVRVGRYPRAVASGDFNRDGRRDLAVIHRTTGLIAILLNQTAARR